MTELADAVWAVLAVALLACEGAALARPARVAGVRTALRRLTVRPGWRLAFLVGWMWLGWHFFAR